MHLRRKTSEISTIEVKVKFTLEQAMKTQRGSRYSSTVSLTLTLDGGGGQCHAPATLLLGRTRYPLYRRLGGPQGRSGQVRKILLPPGFDPQTVQPIASCYSDCSIPAHVHLRWWNIKHRNLLSHTSSGCRCLQPAWALRCYTEFGII